MKMAFFGFQSFIIGLSVCMNLHGDQMSLQGQECSVTVRVYERSGARVKDADVRVSSTGQRIPLDKETSVDCGRIRFNASAGGADPETREVKVAGKAQLVTFGLSVGLLAWRDASERWVSIEVENYSSFRSCDVGRLTPILPSSTTHEGVVSSAGRFGLWEVPPGAYIVVLQTDDRICGFSPIMITGRYGNPYKVTLTPWPAGK